MACVDDHADPVHFSDHLTPHPRDARVFLLVATSRKQALVVIGKLHEPDSHLVTDLDQADVILDGRAVLKTEHDCRPAFVTGAPDIGGA